MNTSGSSASASGSIHFPAYETAVRSQLKRIFELKRLSEPVLGRIVLVEKEHAGPIRSVGGSEPFDVPMKLHSAAASIAVADIEGRIFDNYAKMINTMADSLLESLGKTYFSDMGALITHVGNTIETKGKTLVEQFKDGMMKSKLSFDDDGNLESRQFIVHPTMKDSAAAALQEVIADPEVQAHVQAESRKFLESRPRRRLLSPC